MSLLTHEENKKLNRIIDLEGKIIEFMKHNSVARARPLGLLYVV